MLMRLPNMLFFEFELIKKKKKPVQEFKDLVFTVGNLNTFLSMYCLLWT